MQKNKNHKTLDVILEAAKKLFVEKGFDGTSMSNIAKKCNIGKSLIYHHFESKEALWRAVKEEMFKSYVDMDPERYNLSAQSLQELISQVVTMRFNLYADNPDLVRMMAWQKLECNSQTVSDAYNVMHNLVLKAMTNLQEKGLMNKEIDPAFASYFVLSNASNLFFDMYEQIIDVTSHQRQRYLKQIIDILSRGLAQT